MSVEALTGVPQERHGHEKRLVHARQRRSSAQGWGILANAAHPGYARTDLIANGPGANALSSRLSRWLIAPWASQTPAAGALPTLYAATDPQAKGGVYYGPRFGLVGAPSRAGSSRASNDASAAKQLWEASERLTQVALAPSAATQSRGDQQQAAPNRA